MNPEHKVEFEFHKSLGPIAILIWIMNLLHDHLEEDDQEDLRAAVEDALTALRVAILRINKEYVVREPG